MSKLLIITGASKGIGLATAQRFKLSGYEVLNISRSSCEVDGVDNLAIDLLQPDWSKTWGEKIQHSAAGFDEIVLVHNAAMMTKDSVADIESEALRQVLELNVVASSELNRLLIPSMQEGSSIIYVSSTLGTKAVANTYAYVVSKHAVVGQMRATCQDLAGRMIHTACVCPGFTETEMLQEHLGQNPEVYEQITAGIAHRRLVQPSEIADSIWFCSQSPAVNGTVLHANLGQIEN